LKETILKNRSKLTMDLLNWIDHHQSLRHMLGAQHLAVAVDAQEQFAVAKDGAQHHLVAAKDGAQQQLAEDEVVAQKMVPVAMGKLR
jgi:hypothetical protein